MSQLLHGRYRREAVLGNWDAATTTLAQDTWTGELCVVKSLRFPEDRAPELSRLLKREANAYGQISDPRIPRLIDSFALEEDGQPAFHIVLQHVAGRDLARVVSEDGRLDEPRALALLRTLAEALLALHSCGQRLTHRSVKPQNVVLDDGGEAHLVDFGSWSAAMRRLLGPEGQVAPLDSRGYTPPEQTAGRPVPASDVYALGATVLFALTGRDPSELGPRGPAGAISRLPVSSRLRRLLRRMLDPEPARRYADAGAVLRALEEPGPGARLALPAVLAVAAAALVLVAALVLTSRARWAPIATPAPVARVAPTPPATRPPPQASGAAARRAAEERKARGRARPSPTASRPVSAAPLPAHEPAPAAVRLPSVAPSAERPVSLDEILPPVSPRSGMLAIDVYRDFKYVASGFPRGIGTSQTNASPLDTRPLEALRLPRFESPSVYYGYVTLGNGSDPRFSFAFDELDRPTWTLWFDKNNNQDLTDDGPPLVNQGSGLPFAATVNLRVGVRARNGELADRPYRIWLWVNELRAAQAGPMRYAARFYATCHYAGRVALGNEVFDAVAFEDSGHDGLLGENGIWIDLDRDGRFGRPAEHFADGEEVRTGREWYRLRIEHP